MIRNLFASFVVVLALGAASVASAQEIVTASHGGPVVSEGSCQGGSCARCPDCVRVPDVKVTTEWVYSSRCKEKCAPKCSLLSLFSGHGCGCSSCENGDCEHYHVRRLLKRACEHEECTTKCVPACEYAASLPVAVSAPVPAAPAVAPAPMPAPTPMAPKAY
jgi:hypothetical protein